MKIKDWPLDDRPREKFAARGRFGLTDAELLAIIIGKGTQNRSALDLAKQLLKDAKNLKELSKKSVRDIEHLSIKGLGRTKIIAVLAAFELGRRSLSTRGERKVVFKTPEQVNNYYFPMLAGLKKEIFKIAAVDARNRLVDETTISEGIRDASLVHPYEVFRYALHAEAHGIFLIHNHPSGEAKPSPDDINITERLQHAGEILGIRVIDHIIIADKGYYSFSQHNLL
jgi:DNA repair protein RadC